MRRDEDDRLKRKSAIRLVHRLLHEQTLKRDVVRVAEGASSRFSQLVECVFWFVNGELAGCWSRTGSWPRCWRAPFNPALVQIGLRPLFRGLRQMKVSTAIELAESELDDRTLHFYKTNNW